MSTAATLPKRPKKKSQFDPKLPSRFFLYIIAAGDTHYRKVGICSSCLEQRLKALQVGNFLKLRYVYVIECSDARQLRECENNLHGIFLASTKVLGEWFLNECTDEEFAGFVMRVVKRVADGTEAYRNFRS